MSVPTADISRPGSTEAPAAGEGADDLLSQMAGEEINRLLADADLGPSDQASSATNPGSPDITARLAADTVPAASMDGSVSKELDQVFKQQLTPAEASTTSEASVTSMATAAHTDANHTEESLSADGVADLLGRLSASPDTAATTTSATEHPTTDHDDVGPHERAALVAPPTPTETAAATHASAQPAVQPAGEESRLSRLLDVVTLPLDPFPDDVRDVIGKVAIVTTLNAIAVLIYLLVFR